MTTIFSWEQYTTPLRISASNLTVASASSAAGAIDSGGRRVTLSSTSEPWDEATWTVEWDMGDDPPPNGLQRKDLIVSAILNSRGNPTVITCPLKAHGKVPLFRGSVSITAALMACPITMRVEVAGPIDGSLRILGASDPWRVTDADSDPPDVAGPSALQHRWFDFASPPHQWTHLRATPTLPHFVDASTTTPILCLNEGIEGFKTLLTAKSVRNEQKTLVDMINAFIAAETSAALAREAMLQCSVENGVVGWPASSVLEDEIRSVARLINGTAPADNLIRDYYGLKEADKTDQAATLLSQIELAARQIAGLGEATAGAIERILAT
jgi:hypothetical protein